MPPVKIAEVSERFIKYDYAEKLANDIKIGRNERVSVIVNGSFIFGDFIEAFILKHNIKVKEMTLCTLSYNENNIDSLKNLIDNEWIDNLNIIVSDYFFGHERTNLIAYAYNKLDNDKNKFQLAIERTHCKIYLFETYNGSYFVIQGSVNLRSSGNSEQFSIEENKALYEFYNNNFKDILERNKTINKSLKFSKSWQKQNQETKEGQALEKAAKQNKEASTQGNGTQEWKRHFDNFDF